LVIVGSFVLLSNGANAQNCSQVLKEIALNDPEHLIAHSIHSLTLNMIRHYFNPDATEENGIPTVNLNRSEPNHLNDNAVFVNLTNSMDNYGPFFALDMILSNMDDKLYGIMNANVLDRIAHAMHMHNMWEHASKSYKELVENPPKSGECSCLIEAYMEDIMKNLLTIAKLIRIPDTFQAHAAGKKRNRRMRRSHSRYVGRYVGQYVGKPAKSKKGRRGRGGLDKDEEEEDPSSNLYDTAITNEAKWNTWKNIMKEPYEGYTEDIGRDMAYFMYCHFNPV